MILVQEYLRRGGSYASLLEQHRVHAKPSHGKVSFLYDQFSADRNDLLAAQCRGLILREGTWQLLAYPFDRFFNLGEPFAAPVDWPTARMEEKRDGTLIIGYWDAGRWHVGTRSRPEADGCPNDSPVTFADLVNQAARNAAPGCMGFHDWMESLVADAGCTYLFELTSPHNRVVVEYREVALTLLGIRRLSDFAELDPRHPDHNPGFDTPLTWPFDSIDAVADFMRDWSPDKHEGVVIKDAAFRRVKVKTPQYLACHHAVDALGGSWRSVCEAILTGHADDIVVAVPERIRVRIEELRPVIGSLIRLLEQNLVELSGVTDMKEFASRAQGSVWAAPLFAVKRGKVGSIEEFVKGARAEAVLEACRIMGWKAPD